MENREKPFPPLRRDLDVSPYEHDGKPMFLVRDREGLLTRPIVASPAMMVIASYYVLFALMGASTHVLMLEFGVGAAFIAAAVAGFRTSLWLVVIALAAHGVFDLTHGMFITNPGVPVWWPAFCLAYDVMAAAYLSWLLLSGRTRISA